MIDPIWIVVGVAILCIVGLFLLSWWMSKQPVIDFDMSDMTDDEKVAYTAAVATCIIVATM